MSADNREKLLTSLGNLERGVRRLDEALAEPATNSLAVDGTIQRFEFVIELFWKTFRRALLEEGVETRTPREALTAANRAGWLEDPDLWLAMLKDRNETSRIYNEQMARAIYDRIHSYQPAFQGALELLTARYRQPNP
jgi:nucleotidyltransferase substrate binding protein (TIGR01987 family)